MPPAGRRTTRGAKRDIQEQSDTPEAINTPTRKRRKVNNNNTTTTAPAQPTDSHVPTRPPSAQSDRTVGSDEDHGYGDRMTTEELLTTIVPHLRIASYVTNAQVELSNDLQKRDPIIAQRGSTEAYAKIEGHSWVYFAKSTKIIIGRGEHGYSASATANGNGNSSQAPSGHAGSYGQPPTAGTQVNIDLGPDKQVSRIHAWVEYESDEGHWFILVNGRNGLKLDDRTLSRGEKVRLHSGAVINICGTDMIFVCPGEELSIHPSIMIRAKNSDEEGQDEDSYHNLNNGYGKHADSRGLPPTSGQQYDSSNARQTGQTAPGQTSYQTSAPTPPGPLAPNTPIPSRIKVQQSSPKFKTSPATTVGAYSRGVMLESTEHIDYSADSAKDLKPPHSYAQLIGQAIMSSPEEQLTLANIYEYIKQHYAFYRFNGGGWQNSIRHNLSLSKHFEKVARRTDEPGKGMKWRLVPEERDAFLKKGIHTRKTRMASSGPNSPALAQAAERLQGVVSAEIATPSQPNKFSVKDSPRSVTPPLASYPTANESYTPDRGPQPPRSTVQINNDQIFTPINDRKHNVAPFNASMATFGQPLDVSAITNAGLIADRKENEPGRTPANPRSSLDITYSPPPTNGYKSVTLNDMPDTATLGLVTPLIAKNRPHLAPPSTAKMPSQYCYLSSPAPFWKYADLGSTPARVYNEFSPTKEAKPYNDYSPTKESKPLHLLQAEDDDRSEHEDEDENEAGPVQPSSPPVVLGDVASHSREGSASGEGDSHELSPATPTRPSSRKFNTAEEAAVKKQLPTQLDEDKDEEGIDLMKGFQNIGSFHRGLNQNTSFIRRS